MTGSDGKTKGVFSVIRGLSAFSELTKDLGSTLDSATGITNDLLKHEWGPFTGMDKLASLEGTEELDGVDKAIKDVNDVDTIVFPSSPIETMEDDLICQISIIFLMLENINKRVASIIASCVRRA